MNKHQRHNGFTLLEMLVALAIIALIVSAVYASYISSAQSSSRCQSKITRNHQARTILHLMTRQIRCAYLNHPPRQDNRFTTNSATNDIDMFYGDPDNSKGLILRFDTNCGTQNGRPVNGLYQAAYLYDKLNNQLLYRQAPAFARDNTWYKTDNEIPTLIIDNIRQVTLSFYDGRQWHNRWHYSKHKSLPCAVKITLEFTDDNGTSQKYRTIAAINCRTKTEMIADNADTVI